MVQNLLRNLYFRQKNLIQFFRRWLNSNRIKSLGKRKQVELFFFCTIQSKEQFSIGHSHAKSSCFISPAQNL
jgi:hypothetical protein